MKHIKIILLAGLAIFFVGCGNNDGGNNRNNNWGWQQQGWQQQGQFMFQNGQCLNVMTRQVAPVHFCQQTGFQQPGFPGQMPGMGQQCFGPHQTMQGQVFQCGIQVNCSGHQMINIQTGQWVTCF